MRPVNRDFVTFVESAVSLPGPVYEFGAYQVLDSGAAPDLRDVFPDREFVGCDMRPGPGVDRVLDLVGTGLPDRSVGTVLLLDTLEHVEFPREAVAELRRICADDGVVVISTVMNFPIHSYPDDFWRFTPSGMRSLLRDFPQSWVGAVGDEDHPVSILALAAGAGFPLRGLLPPLEEWVGQQQKWHTAMAAAEVRVP